MEFQEQHSPIAAPVPTAPRRRRRAFAGAFAAAALVGLIAGGSNVMAASPSGDSFAAHSLVVIGGVPAGGTAIDPAAANAAFAKYAACMRDHGIDMPDPVTVDASGTSTGTGAGTGTDSGPVTVTGPISGTTGPGGSGVIHITGGAAVAGVPGAGVIVGGSSATTAGPVTSTPAEDKAFTAADDACASILEAAGIPHLTPATGGSVGSFSVSGPGSASSTGGASFGIVAAGGDPAVAASLKTYATCMQGKGIDVPDPTVDAASGAVQLTFSGDAGSQAFRDANAACANANVNLDLPTQAVPSK